MKKYYFSLKNAKRHKKKKYFGFLIMMLVGSANAQDIPEGFESFFKYQEAQVVVVLNENSIVLNANLKVDSVQLNKKEERKLLNFLSKNNVIISNTSKIIKSLTESSFYAKSCGNKEKSFYSCKIKDFGFYLDYTEHRLYIFLDESYYSQGVIKNKEENVKYRETDSDKISMINNLSYNGYLNNNSKNINVNDSLVTKFYVGQLHSDVDMNLSDEFDLNVNRLYYDYDFFDKFIRVGFYESNDNRYDNKTDLYKLDAAAKKIEFTFGNSSKLIDTSNSKNDKAIQFFMPYNGWAELVRNNETIAFKTLDSGNVKINYSELPKGKYNLKIIIHDQSNKKTQEKEFFISNFDSYGDNELWNYKLSVGEFDKLNDVEDDKKIAYLNTIISKDFNEYINFGLENYISEKDFYLQFGFFANNSLGAFEFNYGVSKKDSYSLESNISSNGLNVSYKKNKVNIDDLLSSKLFGDRSSELLSFNYTNNLYFLNYYLSYVISNNEMNNNTKNRDEDSKNTEWTVGASYTGIGGVNYNLSYSKSIYDNSLSGNEKNSIISFLVEIPFNNLNYSSDFSYLDDRGIIADNIVKANNLVSSQNIESSIYVKQRYNDEHSTNSIGGNISYSNNRYMTNAYIDITDHGEYSFAINGINNISIKDENVNITSHKGDSILKINLNDNDKNKSYGKLVLNNITDSYKKSYDLYNNNIISLVPYKNYTVYFDTELEDYIVKGNTKFDFYSLPGDVITHDVNLHKIKSFIVSFEDFNGNKIDSPKCKGNGCNGIEEVGDGVYSISLISGLDYKVISDYGICLFPDRIDGTEKNFGTRKCFPNIDDTDGRMIVKSKLDNDGKNYEYIGMLSSSKITSDMKEDSSYKMVDADSYTYIFKLLDSNNNNNNNNNIDIVINNKIKALIPRFTYNYRF
ncbi:TPA: CS1-pili formation C-terminal domain-containing protein [Photobacterium damselae]